NSRWARGSWPGIIANPNSEPIRYLVAKYPNFPDAKETERADIFLKEAELELTSNPARLLWLIPRKILILFSPASYMGFDVAYAFSVPFIFAGLVLLVSNSARRLIGILISVPIAAVVMTCALTFGEPRFRAPVDPLLFLASGYALLKCGRLYGLIRLRF